MKLASCISLLAVLLLSGCITPTTVDFEQAAVGKMAAYETFTVDSREQRSDYQDVVLSPIVDRRIERAIQRELAEKGFSQVTANPDFRVTFNTVTKTRTEVNDFGAPPFRRRPYYGYGGRYIDIDTYEEGTFLVDIIDRQSNELVWRGAYVTRLGWSAPKEAEVQQIVSDILVSFPPGATPAAE